MRVIPQENVDTSAYTLRISSQNDRKKQPDYSEAHIAGTLFDPKSPFRTINIQNEEDKGQGASTIQVIHYLAHWQTHGALEKCNYDIWVDSDWIG